MGNDNTIQKNVGLVVVPSLPSAPEPASLTMLAAGLLRRRRSAAKA